MSNSEMDLEELKRRVVLVDLGTRYGVRWVPGIHRRQSSLGGRCVGFLGMGAFGDGQNPGPGSFFKNFDRASKTGPTDSDDQQIAINCRLDA